MNMELGSKKKVSVIVPNYNYAKYLRKRIDSILKQTYPIDELIILDDASTDDSRKVIEKLVAGVKKRKPELTIKTIFNEKNSGKAISQWLMGVKEAKGDYVWIAEADDGSRKNYLAEVMKGFDEPDVVLSYAESAIINGLGLVIFPNFRWSRDKEGTGHFNKSYIRSGKDEIREIMAIRCTIPNVSAVVFKKTPELLQCLEQAQKYTQVGDWYLYAKLLESGKISYERKSLNLFRIHRGSATERGETHLKELAEMHEYFRKNFDLDETVLRRMEAEMQRARSKYGIIE
ncbi:MAG: glycosyltransferase family 2 protein [Candidatus Saccharibacteria bacterium]|nr:glycosyltransferase family 2 protein [Candidatus Saccharibacteria bacterium]